MIFDDPPNERPPTASERRQLLYFGLFFGGLILVELLRDFTPAKSAVFFFMLAWLPLTALHEFGHAGMARLFRWDVGEIVIGYGRLLKTWTWQGARVEVRALPLGGHMVPLPPKTGPHRLASFLIYFAGPGAELAIVLLAGAVMGFDVLLTRTDQYGVIAVQAVCAAAMTGVVVNLIPIPTGSGQWTDGTGMVMSLFLPKEHFDQQRAASVLMAGAQQLQAKNFGAARATFEAALETFPEVAAVHIGFAQSLVGLSERGQALMLLSQAANDRDQSERFRAQVKAALDALRNSP